MAEPVWRRALAALALAAALVLVAVAAGLVPAREPDPPETEAFSVHKTLPPKSLLQPAAPAAPTHAAGKAPPSVAWVPLCEAPERGARLFKVSLVPSQTTLLVWCKQGYELFSIAARSADERSPDVTRLARFKARGELPGGAAAGDFDADGQTDLVLGVAAREGVVHRSGAGVYWLRGRAEGGFESARILAEIGVSAVAAHAHGETRGHELLVLTAGDIAAQRPSELWVFGRVPSLTRERVVPLALDPRGLALRASSETQVLEAWVLSGQPGRLDRVLLDLRTRAVRYEPSTSVSLRGAQSLAHEPSPEGALFVRDATSLWRVERTSPPTLSAFAESARVGPFALADLDLNQQLDVVAAVEGGVAWLTGSAGPSELGLPSELKVLDVETTSVGTGAPLPVALVRGPDAGLLSLVFLPRPPWPPSNRAPIALARTEASQAQSVALVALE